MAVGNSAMKASLVLMLLFGAVVAAHATTVQFTNKTCKPIKVNGLVIAVGQTVDLVLDAARNLVFEVLDLANKLLTGVVHIPADVTKVDCVTEGGKLQINVVGVVGSALAAVTALLGSVLKFVGSLIDGIICPPPY